MKKRSLHKWTKFKVLRDKNKLIRHLPDTHSFSRRSLWDFMNKYGTVMLKPYQGKSGYGIIQVSSLEKDRYVIQNEKNKIIMDGRGATFEQIKKKIRLQKYMVQRRIGLAEIDKRPFDIKVMVQRKKRLPWRITGMLAVVAEKDYVVTNVSRTMLPVKTAIAQSLLEPPAREVIQNIKKVCLLAAKQLGDYYPSQAIIGFDIGLDHDAKVWIIEANFKPSKKPFAKLNQGK